MYTTHKLTTHFNRRDNVEIKLHVRLAYVMRVDDRASIAYAEASVRSVRRGLLSPEVLMRCYRRSATPVV